MAPGCTPRTLPPLAAAVAAVAVAVAVAVVAVAVVVVVVVVVQPVHRRSVEPSACTGSW
jgi:hypothetical protein